MLSDDEKIKFAGELITTCQIYNQSMPLEAAQMFINDLSHFEFDDLVAALAKHRAIGKFAPRVSDLREMIEGELDTEALTKWNQVLQAARSIGSWTTVCFDDPLIHCVIEEMGGWVFLASQGEERQVHNVRTFKQLYRNFRINPPSSHPRKLVGAEEAQNRTYKSLKPAPVRLLGHYRTAASVFLAGEGGCDSLDELDPVCLRYLPSAVRAQHLLEQEPKKQAAAKRPGEASPLAKMRERLAKGAEEEDRQRRLARYRAGRQVTAAESEILQREQEGQA